MPKKTINVKKATNVIRSLVKYKTPHTLKITGSSTYIETDECNYMCTPQFFSYGSLNWISRVKKEILNNLEKQNFSESHFSSEVGYFRFSEMQNGLNYDCVEIDLNKAYWYAALKHKIISKKTFFDGMKCDKMVRLVALGSIATKKDVSYFDGKKYTQLESIFSEKGRSMFFKISKEIDQLMTSNFVDVEDVYFYWCDAFFIRKQSAHLIKKNLKKEGIKFKVQNIESMYVHEHPYGQMVHIIEAKKKEKKYTTYKERTFIKQGSDQKQAYGRYLLNEFLTKKRKSN